MIDCYDDFGYSSAFPVLDALDISGDLEHRDRRNLGTACAIETKQDSIHSGFAHDLFTFASQFINTSYILPSQ